MAEITPSELDSLKALFAEFKSGGGTMKDFAASLSNTASNLKNSSGSFTDTFKQAGTQVGAGVTSFTKSMANGAQGASAFSGIITATSTGLGTMLSKLGATGTALGKMAEFAEGYVVQSLKQSDDLFTAFQGLSKIGGASEEGMKGVFDNMQKFGMTMNEMPQFGAMITQNSEALAMLGGSVSQGTKTFANVAAGIQQSGLQAQFERMGLTIQAQNEGTANFLRLQTLTGASSKKTNEELTTGAAEYIRQQDRLSKLTGKSADTLAKEEEARMSDQRYRALTREMQQKADAAKAAGDVEGAKVIEAQMAANRELLANTPKELQKGVQDLMSGVVNSPEARAMYTSLPEMAQTIMGQNFEASQVLTAGAKEVSGFLDRNTALAKAGLSNQVNIDFAGAANLEAKNRAKTAEDNAKFVKEEQDKLAAGKDVDINNQVAMREAQRATTTAMDNLVQVGVSPLTENMRLLSTTLAGIVTAPTIAQNENLPNQNKLKRDATAAEIAEAKRVNPGMSNEAVKKLADDLAKRGENAPATAGYDAKPIDLSIDNLKKAWKDFTANAVYNLTEQTDKKATDKKEEEDKKAKDNKAAQDEKGKVKPLTPVAGPDKVKPLTPAAAPAAAPGDSKSVTPVPTPAAAPSKIKPLTPVPTPAAAPRDNKSLTPVAAPVPIIPKTQPLTLVAAPSSRGTGSASLTPSSRSAGPAYRTPRVLEENRPENQPSTKSAAADSTTELATAFNAGFAELFRGQAKQTASVDELVELMRRSVGVQGKILQTSRA